MPVYQRGKSPYWYYKFKLNGVSYRGSTKCTNQKRAEKFERELRYSLENGDPVANPKKITYGQLMARYKPPASMRSHYRNVKAAIPASTPHTNIVARAHEMRDAMLEEGYSPCTVGLRLAVIKAMLNQAHKEWHWLDVSLGPLIKKPSVKGTEREYYLTKEQVTELGSNMSEEAALMLWTAALTGLRRGNVVHLKPEHWSPEIGRLVLPAAFVKQRKSLSVPVPKMLHIAMENLPWETTDAILRDEWDAAREACALQHIQFRDLRHTFASWVAQDGEVPLTVLRDVMGHSSLIVTNKYAHLHPNHLAGVSDVFDRMGIND